MKRKSVCAFVFLISLCQSWISLASEDVSAHRLESFQNHVHKLNGYLRGYEAFICHELNKCNLLDEYYGEEAVSLFYFSHERILFTETSTFNPVHFYKDYFKHAGQILIRYFSKKSIEDILAPKYLKVKWAALSLSLKYGEGDMSRERTEAEAEILETLNFHIDPVLDVGGDIIEPIQILETMISKDFEVKLKF